MNNNFHVAFVGNPNCGKTTLFNALTGSKLKVGNWPGVTVEKKEGSVTFEDEELLLIDTPGIYSLSTYTMEEKVTRNCILDDDIEVIVNVLDASNLERNLYLTLQLLELGKPVVIALNMMDIVDERGMEIDLHRLPEMLCDIPIVPVSAVKNRGLDILLHAIIHHKEAVTLGQVFSYGDEIENNIAKLEVIMSAHYPNHSSARWHAIKLLENDDEVNEEHPLNLTNVIAKNYEREIIQRKYDYIDEIVKETLFNKDKSVAFTDKIDKLLLHPILGIVSFVFIMLIVFLITFILGDFIKGYLEILISFICEQTTGFLQFINVSEILISLITDGIINGVGGILTFLPNIVLLFIALAILEDSGYMARVAYVMDGIMGHFGLSGRAFLPMILGFGCTVPAIMATKTLENDKDRLKTMLLVPFMSCSARLPIYIMFSNMFFEKMAPIVAFMMYLCGIIVALFLALVLKLIDKSKDNQSLLIELPEFKRPNFRAIKMYVWNKVKDYLIKAGTTILVASVVIWGILNIGPNGFTKLPSESFAAMFGRMIAPIFIPCGLNMWEAVVALIAGISAKEIVVTSFTVLFADASGNVLNGILSAYPDFGPANAIAIMVFSLLYTPCVASIATIKKESNSVKFTAISIVLQLIIAYLVSILMYQIFNIII